MLFAYRPYLEHEKVFDHVCWFQEDWFISKALSKLRYMDYSYWNELSKQTRDAREAANTIRSNLEIYGVSNDMFKYAANSYLAGKDFPPIIALSSQNEFPLLEGHLRLTALALAEKEITKTRKISVIYGL